MSTLGITRAQRDTMRIIQELTDAAGVPPSFREIANELGVRSNCSVASLIDGLVDRGYLGRAPGRARSLTVLRPVPMAEDVEIVGFFDAPELAAVFTAAPMPEASDGMA
jgi:SOS-response transcriptional repressor LexA